MSNTCALLFASFFLACFQVSGQSEQELTRLNVLDSIAFGALENGLPDVEQKAENLLEASEKSQSNLHLINANTLLGIVNKNKGYYVTAVDFYNKALVVAEEAEDLGRISACYNNIGSVYQIQENFPKALFYFQKSLNIEEKLNNPLQRSIRLYNIGDMYREMDSLSLALSNFNSSLLIEKENQNSEGIVYALLGVADIYLKLDKPIDASISLDEAQKYFDDSDIEIRILYHMLSAELQSSKTEFNQAFSQLGKAKEISKKNDFRIHLADIYEKEVEIKEAQEAFEKGSDRKSDSEESLTDLIMISCLALMLLLIVFFLRRSRKRKERSNSKNSHQPTQVKEPPFELKNDSGKVLLNTTMNKIICFEANDNYVITHYLNKDNELQKSMERASLKKIEELLGKDNSSFYRVHKSHIVNKNHVRLVEGKSQAYKIRMDYLDTTVPVSRSFDITQLSA